MSTTLHAHKTDFFNSCRDKLETAQMIRQNPALWRSLAKNQPLFVHKATCYAESYANPAYLHALGFRDADLLSIIYNQIDRSLHNVVLGRPIFVWNKADIIAALKEYFVTFDREALQAVYDRECIATQELCENNRMLECATTQNAFNAVLREANPDNLDWMGGYGVYITPVEQDMCRYWFSLPQDKLDTIANHIVEAFFHGFISQCRDIAGRSRVRLVYAIGQEALAQRVVALFGERGFDVVILPPSSMGNDEQFLADHGQAQAVFTDPQCYEGQIAAYNAATEAFRSEILATCGFIRIGTFGKEIIPTAPSAHAFRPTKESMAAHHKQMMANRNTESSLLKPDTLSFCSVVFPDMRIGDRFEEIFDAFCKLNTMESEPYELVQAGLIDLLDACECMRLKGADGNKTDLTVMFRPLTDPKKQTNFLNCGGDLNIPHGEMFTTPQLKGTHGALHVKEVYLREKFYRGLWLKFEDGRVVDYTCENFADEEENRRYVADNLLHNKQGVPMGEASIGSNTLAYRLAKDFGLYARLPILLAEKMGPHLAVGDPCFARGEDSPVNNLYGGREMVARENEITATRRENPDCYFNFHTDITIPYEEMGLLEGVKSSGETVTIIRDGRFVPACAQKLNEYLR